MIHNRTINAKDRYLEEYKKFHVDHCFDYLRQSIMCCGDTALEGVASPGSFPEGVVGADGWNVKHVCKNYDTLNSYAERNRATEEWQI